MTKRIVFFFYMSLFFLPSFAGKESYTYSEIKKEPKSPKTDYKIIYDSAVSYTHLTLPTTPYV